MNRPVLKTPSTPPPAKHPPTPTGPHFFFFYRILPYRNKRLYTSDLVHELYGQFFKQLTLHKDLPS